MLVAGTSTLRLQLVERVGIRTVAQVVAQPCKEHEFDLPRRDLELGLCVLQVVHHLPS